jgi:hypothetical protein
MKPAFSSPDSLCIDTYAVQVCCSDIPVNGLTMFCICGMCIHAVGKHLQSEARSAHHMLLLNWVTSILHVLHNSCCCTAVLHCTCCRHGACALRQHSCMTICALQKKMLIQNSCCRALAASLHTSPLAASAEQGCPFLCHCTVGQPR